MTDTLDLAGIGIGPFNLSLAAHLDAVDGVEARFFDRATRLEWHPGMMLPGVELQTSFLKDLVTATHPTSPWSFMSYLVAQKRFYEFLNADFSAIPRPEFARYLGWVGENLSSLRFASAVDRIDFDGTNFRLRIGCEQVNARNLAIAVGLVPNIPAWARAAASDQCFHNAQAANRLDRLSGQRVAVIGGGQSGAEVLLHLISSDRFAGREIEWISMRPNFLPLDDSPFTDELFTPGYVENFHRLPQGRRETILEQQLLAGDGASTSTLKAIYRQLYTLRHLSEETTAVNMTPHREVLNVTREGSEYRLIMRNGFDGAIETRTVDAVVLATGYAFAIPDCMAPLTNRIALDERGHYRLNASFEVEWDGPDDRRIYALNAGRLSHGIAEPQLSLMAWRSAKIVNSLLGRAQFDLDLPDPPVAWSSRHTTQSLHHLGANARMTESGAR
ncbi:SidA/IucD/PvdA family monooxygenase [Mesorhizobium sp. L103C131B0]|uniref:lysine N(6)-hydroxylase/L-ornithine N(5)-oxygenase family protein n=1 Tax=Mesorhizobium sp. L103C131B0 TaxID=1287089 RepID=UPI0003CFAA12|nr:SidA/IucD/PvdA family monooxygenase [Mesorhizobium sp. L103C131B0]ESZ56541.1 lysine 6-monooxygenase [Mesorhizobium sp. L103C131B0]